MRLRNIALAFGLALMLVPATAKADWIATPFIGGNFNGDATSDRHLDYGIGLGYMGAQSVGFETVLSYSPGFFGSQSFIGAPNAVMTWMGNLIVGIPIGGETQVRPYVSGGAGLMRSRIGGNTADILDITSNDFGVNVGGGAMGFFTPHVGLRGDLRYFHSVAASSTSNGVSVDLGRLHYWRGTVGVSFRW